jgi:Lrp/AsnC family transcriptional regulator, leucine-responsive regulatory protein
MDEVDRALLNILQEDGRRSYGELGEVVGLSVSGVNERIKRLRARGIIRGTVALLEPHAVGLDVLAFVQVLLDRPEHEDGFRRRIAAIPQVLECHHVTGDWSYLLKIRTRTTGHLEAVMMRDIKTIPGVVRTQTLIALSSPKETTALDLSPDAEPERG